MGYELLETVTGLLTAAGLRAGEEFPGGKRMEILAPAAAVGLQALDPGKGVASFSIRILSPRMLGGWCCQVWASRAVQALTDAGMDCQTAQMDYRGGSDCFCVVVTARCRVAFSGDHWEVGSIRQIWIGETIQKGVESFQAVRRQERRIIGAFWQAAPVAVTPGKDGWELELVQIPQEEPEEGEEPFTLTLREGDREIRYTGCCWNETLWQHHREGLRLTRRGFALGREVSAIV